MVFVFILGVALIYELSTGALDWGLKTRTGKAQDMPHPEVEV